MLVRERERSGEISHRCLRRRFFCWRFFSARSMSTFGTASSPRVKFVSRSSGESPDILIFMKASIDLVAVAAAEEEAAVEEVSGVASEANFFRFFAGYAFWSVRW